MTLLEQVEYHRSSGLGIFPSSFLFEQILAALEAGQALRAYADHKEGCSWYRPFRTVDGQRCSCGFREL
jgi:hypothetical protein